MIATKLSKLLYETPLSTEAKNNLITIYNLRVVNTQEDIDEITVEDLDRIFEDFDLICDTYEIKAISKSSVFILGLIRDQKELLPPLDSIKLKGIPTKFLIGNTVEDFIDYLAANKITLTFEPTLINHKFNQYWR